MKDRKNLLWVFKILLSSRILVECFRTFLPQRINSLFNISATPSESREVNNHFCDGIARSLRIEWIPEASSSIKVLFCPFILLNSKNSPKFWKPTIGEGSNLHRLPLFSWIFWEWTDGWHWCTQDKTKTVFLSSPEVWVSSLIFRISLNFSGETHFRESKRLSKSERLYTNFSRGEPETKHQIPFSDKAGAISRHNNFMLR